MSLSIDGNGFLNVLQSTGTIPNEKTENIERTLSNAKLEEAKDEELMEVCEDFETYFVQKVFEEMKKTVHSSDDENSYMKYMGDIYTQGLAEEVTKSRDIGLAKTLYESMKRNGL
ncbi:rod-binding protein [[Clostridium] polysaccharolyticum]|uniref:Rod binding protein n=1 Tax=[Clostridium] polysaccharolyticum TaxID=29364 RepID=A0A1I0FWP3_9FIRM|nr:rod-binding protein [[Clostridium] polysaccharolyticum]SET62832.1 Rod binding protein [[Clostridium] polysaccharolyticum]